MSDEMLRRHAAAASEALQAIQDLAKGQDVDAAKVRFPRGYLTTVDEWHGRLPWMRTYAARKNVAYTLMLLDIQRWLLKRTDLAGHAADMLVKACLASQGAIVEALIVDATSPPLGGRQKMLSRIGYLEQRKIVATTLQTELKWLWDMRNRQHLQELQGREFGVYRLSDIGRADSAIWALCDGLNAASGAGAA